MNQKPSKLILLLIASTMISCGIFGNNLPKSNGVYFVPERGEAIRLMLFEGKPTQDNYINLLEVNQTPSFMFWEPYIRIELVNLYNIQTISQHPFTYRTEKNDVINVFISEPLPDGIYCFGQGDPLAAPSQIKHWCFRFGNVIIEETVVIDEELTVDTDPNNDTIDILWEENIKFDLVMYDEIPSDPGYKFLDIQVLIQNVSDDKWIKVLDSPNGYASTVTTADDFHYKRENRTPVRLRAYGEDLGNYYHAVHPVITSLPPGFQTLVARERWLVSEYSTDPVLNISLRFSFDEQFLEMKYDLPLNDQNLLPYPQTPFVNNFSWDAYKQNYASDALTILGVGDKSKTFDFGDMVFSGIYFDNRRGREELIVSMDFMNSSLGYPLGLFWEFGDFIDGGIGFTINLSHPIQKPIVSSEYDQFYEEFVTTVAPGQTGSLGWSVQNNIFYSDNWQNPFPSEYADWKKPFCILSQNISWDREDIAGVRSVTEINLIACQD